MLNGKHLQTENSPTVKGIQHDEGSVYLMKHELMRKLKESWTTLIFKPERQRLGALDNLPPLLILIFKQAQYSKNISSWFGLQFLPNKMLNRQNLNQNCKWSGIQSAELITLDGERDGVKWTVSQISQTTKFNIS